MGLPPGALKDEAAFGGGGGGGGGGGEGGGCEGGGYEGGGGGGVAPPHTNLTRPNFAQMLGGNPGKQGKPQKDNPDRDLNTMLMNVRSGNPDAAIAVFQNRAANGFGASFTVKQYSQLIQEVSLMTEPEAMYRFLDTVGTEYINFASQSAAAYMHNFGKLTVIELLEECQQSIKKASGRTSFVGGGCAPMLMPRTGKGGTEMVLDGQLPPSHGFQKGDFVLLTFPHTALVGSHGCEAEIATMMPLVVKAIATPGEKIKAQFLGKTCRMDKVANKVTYSRSIEALKNLCQPNEGLSGFRDLILNSFPDFAAPELTQRFCSLQVAQPKVFIQGSQAWHGINESQTMALQAAMCQRLTLIQGPPGTGKTHTSIKLMQLWTQNGCGPVMATADSNIAVDNLLTGCVAAGLSVVRIGRPESTRPELEQYMLENMARKDVPAGSHPDVAWKLENQILKTAQIVCCTCSGAASGVMERCTFTGVLIDEAAQATEPVTIIPIVRGGVKLVALVGDHKQLPPTVVSRTAESLGLGVSLFDRLTQRGVATHMLNVQYRMHVAIATYPSEAFYEGQLATGVPGVSREAPAGFAWPSTRAPVAFIPCMGCERSEGNSFANEQEAELVAQTVANLLAAGDLEEKDIGVISPYAAQVRHIRKRVGGSRPGRFAAPAVPGQPIQGYVEVSSVDGFQGREKEVIIVSTVRANHMGELGFVKDLRRMNVTLTRAKRGIIVIGHTATLCSDNNSWGAWLHWCCDHGLFMGNQARSPDKAMALLAMHDAPATSDFTQAAVMHAGGGEMHTMMSAAMNMTGAYIGNMQENPAAKRMRFGNL